MATNPTGALTFADWARRTDPDGKEAVIIELLSQTNEILEDMLVMEGNLPTGHRTTVRTGLPIATWRLLNYGVPTARSTTVQITDSTGMLETYSIVDKALADLNGNTAEFRLSEAKAFLEGMSQQMAQVTMYGNTAVNPERFMGFAPRYSTVSTTVAQTAYNVIDGLGTGSVNTSLWLVCWGNDTVAGIFPKGKITGLQHKDWGDQRQAYDTNTPIGRYEAYTDHYKWDLGLCQRDWRYTVRLCNIDTTSTTPGLLSATPVNLINAMVRMVHRLPTAPASAGPVQKTDAPSQGLVNRCAFYCNRLTSTYLDIQALNKTNVLLQMQQWDGKPVTTFRGIPVRTVDAITSTEARVV
jgi:hypothetical protein